MNIILGSKSPRRKELLAGMGLEFSVVNIDANESYPSSLSGEEIPLYISRAKALAYARELKEQEVLITADTIVWVDGQVLGKPKDEQDAFRMLRLLSGKTHQVFTGVTIATFGASHQTQISYHSFADTTDVTFRELTDDEIWHYIHHYKPLDKAGAYGIQEWIGYVGCTRLNGSYFNVMGLPTEALYEHLSDLHIV